MRVLVTGASGFIGRHLVARLGAEGHEVVGASWLRIPFRVFSGQLFWTRFTSQSGSAPQGSVWISTVIRVIVPLATGTSR